MNASEKTQLDLIHKELKDIKEDVTELKSRLLSPDDVDVDFDKTKQEGGGLKSIQTKNKPPNTNSYKRYLHCHYWSLSSSYTCNSK